MSEPDPPMAGSSAPQSGRPSAPLRLFADVNRGLLLDLAVFAFNLSLLFVLTDQFNRLIHAASDGSPLAMRLLFGFAVSLFVLAPIGAVLKRWHYHQRVGRAKVADWSDHLGGCLFNPIFYFCLTALIFSSVVAFVLQEVYGRREVPGEVFVPSIFVGIGLMILHIALVYSYFSPPRRPPKSAFLRSRVSNVLGDVSLFANMMLFQLIWNALSRVDAPHPTGVFDFVFRFLILCFLALLLYFPPRMFYLAEDIGKRRTWAMIFLANSPLLYRFMIGSSSGSGW
jgi:hypothetical protein